MEPKVTLEQWRALLAVIDAGGYARAAEQLGKSQSSVSYAISQLETALGVKVFALEGRRAVPTPAGELLHRRARHLLEEADRLEQAVCSLHARIEPVVRIAVDHLIPATEVLSILSLFAADFPNTRVEYYESVLSGTEDALVQGQVDLAVGTRIPPGFLGDYLKPVTLFSVSSPDHPLQRLQRELTYEDLRHHRQIIVRDSGPYRRYSEGWQEAEQRWTVSHLGTSIAAVRAGLAYALLPEAYIQEDLLAGRLRHLPLRDGSKRVASVYLMFADQDLAGPATRRLAEIVKSALRDS